MRFESVILRALDRLALSKIQRAGQRVCPAQVGPTTTGSDQLRPIVAGETRVMMDITRQCNLDSGPARPDRSRHEVVEVLIGFAVALCFIPRGLGRTQDNALTFLGEVVEVRELSLVDPVLELDVDPP